MQTLSLSITPAQTAAWRKQIFQQLTERTKRELENFRHYEQAVEQVRGAGRRSSAGAHLANAYCIPAPRWQEEQVDACIPLSSHLGWEAIPSRSLQIPE